MKNSQTLAPGLYIVATPIGNLEDITLRALRVLKEADIIACEDTRASGKLLKHFDIRTRTTSFHDHNEKQKTAELLAALQAGKIVALISDAGTPLISDPGFVLVKQALAAGIPVIPIPGASSVLAALCVSGLPIDKFCFAGFLPVKENARQKAIEALAAIPATLVLFEATRRLSDSIAALGRVLGNREAVVARELTKLHEELRRGTLDDLAAYYAAHDAPKGEAVLVIAPPAEKIANAADAEALLLSALATMSVKDAAQYVAQATGLPRQQLYAQALTVKADNINHDDER